VRAGATTVLLCFSGNRSSELVDEFRKEGIECRFLIGGYEKWIAEGSELELGDARSRSQLRELSHFPGESVLLDTPDVVATMRAEGAIFVDVRYPEDFNAGHLPGAINVPVRKLRTMELQRQLRALPDKPVIVPCYDKRSSFYALILGLRLHRSGGVFMGRYTVPHEYFVPSTARSHVVAWQAEQAGVTLFGLVKGGLQTTLTRLQEICGSLALAILLLVVLVRGGLCLLSFKADVDQCRRQQLQPQVKELQRRFADDPGRARRAVLNLYRGAHLTPGRNLGVSIGQLLLFLVFFAVVREAATDSTETFLGWQLGAPDGLGILPILVGVLMGAIMCNGQISRGKIVFACLLGLGLALLTWGLSVAANLYLVCSLLWVLVQCRLARHHVHGRKQRQEADLSSRGVVTLREAAHAAGAGNKAIRLGLMKAAGLPVPDGFAITDHALDRAHRQGALAASDRVRIARMHRRLRAERVAVRSSGLNEDGGDKSYAGVFESVLDVTHSGLFEAIDYVRKSMNSDRARTYGEDDERGGIVVQAMVPAECAGVLFTEHPGCSGSVLVELVEGLCEQLVGGTVTPKAFQYARVTGRPLDGREPAVDLAPLLALGRRVEKLFGAPQDIEWAYANGRFYLLQARDITVTSGTGSSAEALRQRERARLLARVQNAEQTAGQTAEQAAEQTAEPNEVVLAQNELSELLPKPTPFSLDFMNSLWAAGGSVDLACRSMGIPYAVSDDCSDYVMDVFGRLFVDCREEQRRLAKGFGGLASFRLTRGADAMEQGFRKEFLPEFHKRMRVLEATDLTRLSDSDLFGLWRDLRDEFVTSTYVEAERINIAADFFVKTAGDHLQRRGFDPAAALSNIPTTVVHRAFGLLPGIGDGHVRPAAFLELFGHRARHDFEFSERRYAEAPTLVDDLAARAHSTTRSTRNGLDKRQSPEVFGRFLTISVDRARRFQALKEEAKHEAMRELAVFRAVTLEIGQRIGLDDEVFWLLPDEVDALEETGVDETTRSRIEERAARAEACEAVELPVRLAVRDLEALCVDGGPMIHRRESANSLTGTRVAGEREVVGRVRVLRDTSGIDDFQEGEILVARFTDPTWSGIFPVAGGLITEVGGWLSHAAIQAREYGLACIVDVTGAMDSLETGQLVRLGLDGTVEKVADSSEEDQDGSQEDQDGSEEGQDGSEEGQDGSEQDQGEHAEGKILDFKAPGRCAALAACDRPVLRWSRTSC
ncbi:MAG: PEP/pyruvate-binding domain-containing protein, partial [Planctomycetota bacterium]|jgi:membrane protein insertase Oxa1/YidC/SpoIIIJ/rhodanese-related sulfurtransferase/phosphohistidine swiveling domain-containing protein